MKKILMSALLLGACVCFSGCGGEDAAVSDDYAESAPREAGSGPIGAGAAGAGGAGEKAPAPPPL